MYIIKQEAEIIHPLDFTDVNKHIERCARICHKSEDKINEQSAEKMINFLLESGHHSVIEHFNISVKMITDRSVTHELVRHRLASYSQESQRYVNYQKKGNQIQFILPVFFPDYLIGEIKTSVEIRRRITGGSPLFKNPNIFMKFYNSLLEAESLYFYLLDWGWSPQNARGILPNATKTEIIITANIREWRHIFNLRCSEKAHPQIRNLILNLLQDFKKVMPLFFNDLYNDIL